VIDDNEQSNGMIPCHSLGLLLPIDIRGLISVGPRLPDKDESCIQSGKTRLLGS
jgi:hypothetical protein